MTLPHDLKTGKTSPIDAPIGDILFYFTPKKALWSRNSRRVLLLNTYLPLQDVDEAEKSYREKRPCVAVVDANVGERSRLVRPRWKWRIMKSSRREGSRAAKRKVGWEKESPRVAWCRDGSADNDEQSPWW